MEVINVFAMVGMFINDLMAILSLLGSTILLLGSFSKMPLKRYGRIADWSILGLIFGIFFQLSMAITGTTPGKHRLYGTHAALNDHRYAGLVRADARW